MSPRRRRRRRRRPPPATPVVYDGGGGDSDKGVLTDAEDAENVGASGPSTMLTPKKTAKVTRKLFEYDENDPGSESAYAEYQCKMREREAIELRIPPIRTNGGFMGY